MKRGVWIISLLPIFCICAAVPVAKSPPASSLTDPDNAASVSNPAPDVLNPVRFAPPSVALPGFGRVLREFPWQTVVELSATKEGEPQARALFSDWYVCILLYI